MAKRNIDPVDGKRIGRRCFGFHVCRSCGVREQWALKETNMKRLCPKCYKVIYK